MHHGLPIMLMMAAGCAAGCGLGVRTGAEPATRPHESVLGIAHRIESAHGRRAWDARPAVAADLAVTFGGQKLISGVLLYDHHTGRVRIDVGEEASLIFDGTQAWVAPGSAEVPQARFHLLTWPYFLAAPFKLRDPGTHLAMTGKRTLDGKALETALLTFGAGVGDSPDDWYVIYEDADTGRLAAMAYIITYGGVAVADAENEVHAIVYRDFESVEGVTLATHWVFRLWSEADGVHGPMIGEARLANVRFVKPDPDAFTAPAGAKEDRLPPRR